ncbi:hypothetical protein KEJ34_00160 [Candidatus Bathyarchaeota archaeon]|nr:hypothetical protein [Candidatus Bathyarchaeota archaeon]
MKERGIEIENLRKVFESPRFRFYDIASRAEVIVGESFLYNLKIFLVVIFRRRDDYLHCSVHALLLRKLHLSEGFLSLIGLNKKC